MIPLNRSTIHAQMPPRQDDQRFGAIATQKERIGIAKPAFQHGESFAAFFAP